MNTPEEVRRWLLDHVANGDQVAEPFRLSGGWINHVWKAEVGDRTLVVKHAGLMASGSPDIRMDPSRILFEARAMEMVRNVSCLADLSSHVRVPQVVFVDPVRQALAMEFVGPAVDLQQAMDGGWSHGIDVRMEWLGRYFGLLHGSTSQNPALGHKMDNAPVQRTRREVQYEGTRKLLEGFDLPDAEQLGQRVSALGEDLLAPGCCLIMGDLWPRSVLLGAQSTFLIDWEFSHYGRPLQDIAHLAAHMRLWSFNHPGQSANRVGRAWRRFVGAYLDALQEQDVMSLWSAREREDAVVHMASELMVRVCGPFATNPDAGMDPGNHPIVHWALTLLSSPHQWDVFDVIEGPVR